jgi:hypothetical protein
MGEFLWLSLFYYSIHYVLEEIILWC